MRELGGAHFKLSHKKCVLLPKNGLFGGEMKMWRSLIISLVLLLAVILMFSTIGLAAPVTLDFEGSPVGWITGWEYSGYGVLFSSQGGSGAQEFNYGGWITEVITSDTWYHPLIIDFVNPSNSSEKWTVTSVSMENHFDEDYWIVTAYDLFGNLLDTKYVNYEVTWVTFGGIGYIHSVKIDASQTAFAMDNLTFDGLSPVPEPATLLLLGLGGLIIKRLKFKN